MMELPEKLIIVLIRVRKTDINMERMKTDPELKQAMMEDMARMSLSRENMMDSGMMDS